MSERHGGSTLHNKQDQMGVDGTYKCKYSGLYLNCLGPNQVYDAFTGALLGADLQTFVMRDPHDHKKEITVLFNRPEENPEGADIMKRALFLEKKYPIWFKSRLQKIAGNYGL